MALTMGPIAAHDPEALSRPGNRGGTIADYKPIWERAEGLRRGQEFVVSSDTQTELYNFYRVAQMRSKNEDTNWTVNIDARSLRVTVYRPYGGSDE